MMASQTNVIKALESLEGRLNKRIDKVANGVVRLATRVDEVEARLSGSIAELRLEINGKFDTAFGWLERLQTEYHMLVVGLKRIEEQMAEEREDRARLLAQVTDLRERVEELEARLAELEARLDEDDQEPPAAPRKPA